MTNENRAEEILRDIIRFIPSFNNKFNRLDCDVDRPREVKEERNRFNKSIPHTENFQLHLDCFQKTLNFIPASKKRKDLFTSTYVFPDEEILIENNINSSDIQSFKEELRDDFSTDHYANISKKHAEILLDYLIDKAISQKREKLYDNDVYSRHKNHSTFFLLGDPGIGKSTFVNYLFSVYASRLIEKKVIWVRLHFNRYNHTKSINNAFLYRAIRIIKEHYSDDIDLSSDILKNYIKEKWKVKSEKDNFNSFIDNQFQELRKLRLHDIESQLDASFINYIIEFIIERLEYSVIFIIDGLDNVTLDEVHNEKFNQGCKNLVDCISDRYFIPALFIVVMREISFIDAQEYFPNDANWRNLKKFKILPINLKEMTERKFIVSKALIKHEFEKLNKKNFDDRQIENLIKSFLMFTFCSLLNRKVEELNSENIHLIEQEGFKILNEICCRNYRLIMRFFRYLLLYVLSYYNDKMELLNHLDIRKRHSCLVGKEYKVKRVLLIAREENENYEVAYRYEIKHEKVVFKKKAPQPTILPNIYNFIDALPDSTDNYKQEYRALLKLHIIQYFIKQSGQAKKKRVIEYFNEYFGYSVMFLNFEIDEMIYSGILRPKSINAYVHAGNYTLELTELGNYLLKNIIDDQIYIGRF
jgi:hypothetical protein